MSNDNTPRIYVLLESYSPIIGGMETQAHLINSVFADNDLDVTVITRRIESSFKKIENINGVVVKRIPPKGFGHLKRWVMMITTLPYLFFGIKKYDIILVSGFRTLGIPAILISKMFNKISILKADNTGEFSGTFFIGGLGKIGFSENSHLFKILLKIRNLLLLKADAFVSLSNEMTAEFKDQMAKVENIYEIPNCFDPNHFYPVNITEKLKIRTKLNLPINKRIVIFTGRLLTTKGLPLLLKVWFEIQKHHKDILLLIVGSGENLTYSCDDELRDYVREKNIQEKVMFTGKVYNVHEYLQSSDIFCLPTENEAFGISLVEAMACRLAPVATTVGGIKDIITHNYNGYLIDTGNFDQLFFYLDLLLKNEEQVIKMGENAFLTVREKYSKFSVAQKYITLFKELAVKKYGSYPSYLNPFLKSKS